MGSPTLYLVHAFEHDAAGAQVVGVGPVVVPVETREFRKPPMVVLMVDREAVHVAPDDEPEGHDRVAIFDEEVLTALGALHHPPGQELGTTLERAADSVGRREKYGGTVAPSREFTVYVPTTQLDATLRVEVADVGDTVRVLLTWTPAEGARRVFALDEVATRELARQVTRLAGKVRRIVGDM